MIDHCQHAANVRALLAPVARLLDDPSVGEILINGPERVYAERAGTLELTDCRFRTHGALLTALRGIAQYAGLALDADTPVLEARLPDGSRIEAVVPPIAQDGPLVTIRRVARTTLTLDDLVMRASLDASGAELLDALVAQRRNILVSGGTGSGKTSLLAALAMRAPSTQRIVVIEDSRELELEHDHAVYLTGRPADAQGRGEMTVRQLFRASLRLRPDRIVVGEIRGPEALDLVQAMTSGHGGCLSTVHATSPADALARIETLALMAGVQLPLWALRTQIAAAVHVIVQVERTDLGRRLVREITSVQRGERDHELRALYRADDDAGHATGLAVEHEGAHDHVAQRR